ncbi:MAG: PD-(D/E)XK nuclease family protein [Culicoidibacterales bacterium]
MKVTNLFQYATSELSQDAFICWLLSHATAEGRDENPDLRQCAQALLQTIFINNPNLEQRNVKVPTNFVVKEIKKQYKNIDVLIIIDDLYVIIEDKTFTNTHGNQVNRYKNSLLAEGILEEHIICVYYKIIEQPYPEPNVDFEFTRQTLLPIFRKYAQTSQNPHPLVCDYLAYLEEIEVQTNAYTQEAIHNWHHRTYRGFFTHLNSNILTDGDVSWGYVANKSGGFMGLWWLNLIKEELRQFGVPERVATDIYLQIEDNKIAVKHTIDPEHTIEKEHVVAIRRVIQNFFIEQIGTDFNTTKYSPGRWMTVGVIHYDQINYETKLNEMKRVLQKLPAELKDMTFS